MLLAELQHPELSSKSTLNLFMLRFPIQPSVLLLAGGVLYCQSLWAQVDLKYIDNIGDQWHIKSRIDEEILLNGKRLTTVEILNKISAKVIAIDAGVAILDNTYHISEKPVGKKHYTWSQDYQVRFSRDRRGYLSGYDVSMPIPSVRDLPVFPEKAVKIFDRWESKAKIILNLEPVYGLEKTLEIAFTAYYRYLGPSTWAGRQTEKIVITYTYQWEIDSIFMQSMKEADLYPIAILGECEQTIYWDPETGKNYGEEGVFIYTHDMNDGSQFVFQGVSQGHVTYTQPMDSDDLIREMNRIDDVQASAVDEGIHITLDNIHFMPNSPEIVPGEENKLEEIARVLRKIPDKDILITGHTASVPGYGDGQELSEQRAGTVARYFIDTGTRKTTQIVTKGMGDRQPLIYNDTEEGRKENRRVEIIILEN